MKYHSKILSSIITCLFFTGFIFAFMCLTANAQITNQFKNANLPLNISLSEFCSNESEALQHFFDEVNLDYPGLENTKQAVIGKNWEQASISLVNYFKSRQKNNWLLNNKDVIKSDSYIFANDVLSDNFTFQGISGKIHRLANGRVNWYYKGPKMDIEWAFFLNRHSFLKDLSNVYQTKKDEKYAKCYNDLLMDWILSNPVYLTLNENQTWRPLEVGIRVGKSWIPTFFNFQQAREFSSLTRLLMLISFYDHASYLQKYHGKHHNHAVTEFINLATIALNFPEFKKANNWYNESLKGMEEEFIYSVYPDGAVKELTSHYHAVIAKEFNEFILLNKEFGKMLPLSFNNTVEKMYNYIAYTVRPDGNGLLNNDSDLGNNFDIIKYANTIYKRPDWDYIISNGKLGKSPKQISQMFPWAGHFIMRNGYGEKPGKEQFAYFDMGPWGTTHQHNDKLHVSLYAYGRELLCDNGRMYYKRDSIRSYFNLSIGHNTIALDDKGQNETKTANIEPTDSSRFSIQPNVDFAIGSYDDGFGDISRHTKSYSSNKLKENINGQHKRAVLYLKNRYWIIVDQINTDKPRKLTAYWHFNPDCNVKTLANTVYSDNLGKANLLIHPVGNSPWKIELVKGQDSPYVQGWYSESYNNRQPAYCAEYRTRISKNVETFAWIMYPSKNNKFPIVSTRVMENAEGSFRFEVDIEGQQTMEIAVNMGNENPIKLSNNRLLTGRCAILQKGNKPIVIHGKITDRNGKVIVAGK